MDDAVDNTAIGFSTAKATLSDVYDDVEAHGVRLIQRRKSPQAALVRSDLLADLLADKFPFTTSVSRAEDGTVAVWLEEFELYGRGSSFDAAVDDLIDDLLDYLDDWDEFLQHAPNHDGRQGWVMRLKLAGSRPALRDLLLAAPAA